MADIVAFNQANAAKALRFGQDIFLAAEATRGDLSELEYRSARAMDLLHARTRGLDAYMAQHKLDAVVFPGMSGCGASPPRRAIPASRCRRASSRGVDGKETPDYPLGVTFTGRAWSEANAAAAGLRLRAGIQGAPAAAGTAGALAAGVARPQHQPLSWRAMNSLATSRALSVCGPGSATHSWTAFSNSR